MIWIAGLMLLFFAGSSAKAEDLPRFNIEAMCRAAPTLGASDQNTDQNCVRDETQARSQLEQKWGSYDARQRNMCVEETNSGGAPSYVDVLTCIEMASGNPIAAPAQRTPRHR
jgi:hypothetical protein